MSEERPNRVKLANGKWLVRTQAGLRAVIKKAVANGGLSWKSYDIQGCENIKYPCVIKVTNNERGFELYVSHRPLSKEIDILTRTLDVLRTN